METAGQENVDTTIVSFAGNNAGNGDDHGQNTDYADEFRDFARFLTACIIPGCILGLAANTVSVWVWKTNKKHNPMVMLFQCLGITDNLYLLQLAINSALFYADLRTATDATVVTYSVAYFIQGLSVHITLTVGVFRWLAVARPHLMQRVKNRHALMTCGGMGAWCGLLTSLVIVNTVNFWDLKTVYWTMYYTLEAVMFVLPILVLLGFSIRLLRITFRRQQGRQQVIKKRRRMTMAVLCISGCSFLNCLMGMLMMLIHHFITGSIGGGSKWTWYYAVNATAHLVYVFNSSVNLLFYVLFASKFRPLLWQTFGLCWDRLRNLCRRFFITSDSSEVTTSPGDGHCSRRCHQQGTEDETEDESAAEDLAEEEVVEVQEATTSM